MGVGVDEAGDRYHPFRLDSILGIHLLRGLAAGPEPGNLAALDEEIGLRQDGAGIVHGHHGGASYQPASQLSPP